MSCTTILQNKDEHKHMYKCGKNRLSLSTIIVLDVVAVVVDSEYMSVV